ncbi:hypothetical protein BRADI_3g04490v3 [Brachypodium distachyon]|uniref:CBS domain-containing protein n=2 Tax=Brachypodium distachyon TaxID=15368 RepID=I1HXF3_BRADI|nr:hypothetical protein BRADI_3g04490v3 [Brachypodium distachyon]
MAQMRVFGDEHGQQELLRGEFHGSSSDKGDNSSNKKARAGLCGLLRERKVLELARGKRRLVEVPYTATLAHAANALLAGRVSAVTVAAPPGHWIGAGGSMIVESDPATGAARKHYIGMVNMLDIVIHIAEAGQDNEDDDLDRRMAVPVSSVIGHSLEGLTLWTLHPNTSVLDCMETFSKGVHRALVPLESSAPDTIVAVELVESAPAYKMVTQMDVVRFLRDHGAELGAVLSRTVGGLGAASEAVLAVASRTTVIEAVRTMRAASLTAVPVVDAPVDAYVLQDGRGKKVVETFSATDLRDCPVARLRAWLGAGVTEFKEKVAEYRREGGRRPLDSAAAGDGGAQATDDGYDTDDEDDTAAGRGGGEEEKRMVTCTMESTLGEVVEKAVENHVHRLWVVDEEEGLLRGVVSLTDVLRVVREAALGEDQELHSLQDIVSS